MLPFKRKTGLRKMKSLPKLRFSTYLAAPNALPVPPEFFGHYGQVVGAGAYPWDVLGNADVGDCFCAGAAHSIMLWNAAVGLSVRFAESDVITDYSAITGYKPGDASTDNGTDMLTGAEYWRETGFRDAQGTRHHIMAELEIDVKNLAHIMLAAWWFGCVGLNVDLPADAEEQFERGTPWALTSVSASGGYHFVPLVGRNSLLNPLCVTWGRLHGMTPSWLQARLRECVVFLSPEYISKKSGLSPEHFNLAQLQGDLAEL